MSENNNETVGIIIPCKNHGKYLKRAINSVLSQDWPVSICIVNDGSDDNSGELARSLFTKIQSEQLYKKDAVTYGFIDEFPLTLIDKEICEKQAKARNIAIKMLWEGVQYFCQLDADDLYMEGKLKRGVEVLKSDPFIGLVYNDVVVFNELQNTYIHEFHPSYDRRRLENENYISNAPVVKKEVFLKVGIYDEELPPCEDWDMWLRITEKYGAMHIPEALQIYSITGNSCNDNVDKNIWIQQRKKVIQKLMERKKDVR